MSGTEARGARTGFWLAGLAVTVVLVYLLRQVLMPFVVGMLVAYFLDPLADRLEKQAKISRTIAVTLITAVFFGLVVVLLTLLLPPLIGQVEQLAAKVPAMIEALRGQVKPILERFQAGLSPEQAEKLKGAAGDWAGDAVAWLGHALKGVLKGGIALFNTISLVVIAPIVSFYLLRDWDHIVAWVDGYLPREQAPVIREQVRAIDTTLSCFLRGQASVVLVLAVYYAVGLTVVGLELGLLVGLGAGVVSFIPYVGAALGLVTGLGIALFQFSDWLPIFLVAAIFLVGQTAESYILQPKLVGEKVGLHPVWLIFALLAGGALFGFTGVLLAVPVAAIIGVLIRFALGRYKTSLYYLGSGGDA